MATVILEPTRDRGAKTPESFYVIDQVIGPQLINLLSGNKTRKCNKANNKACQQTRF